jgi:hypothetical protein
MTGNESAFTRHLTESLQCCHPWDAFTYVEIGVAEGKTLAVASQIIYAACKAAGRPDAWKAIGIDIPEGWSLNEAAVAANNRFFGGVITRPYTAPFGSASLILEPSQQCLTVHQWPPIHFAFIDGCHGKPCAIADFLALEKLMAPGGIVAFHDASEKCQGHHMQPHCRTGIDVRAALKELCLLPPDKRGGWTFLEEPVADHACSFFKKE